MKAMIISKFNVYFKPTQGLCNRFLASSYFKLSKHSTNKSVKGSSSTLNRHQDIFRENPNDFETESRKTRIPKTKFVDKRLDEVPNTAYQRGIQIMTSAIFVPDAEKSKLKPQFYDYFLVLDFEATCEDGKQIKPQVS